MADVVHARDPRSSSRDLQMRLKIIAAGPGEEGHGAGPARSTPGSTSRPRSRPFFKDLPARDGGEPSCIVARSGASTVAELTCDPAGHGASFAARCRTRSTRTSTTMPASLMEADGAVPAAADRIEFAGPGTPREISLRWRPEPSRLTGMAAAAARTAGAIDAAQRLADLVLRTAGLAPIAHPREITGHSAMAGLVPQARLLLLAEGDLGPPRTARGA